MSEIIDPLDAVLNAYVKARNEKTEHDTLLGHLANFLVNGVRNSLGLAAEKANAKLKPFGVHVGDLDSSFGKSGKVGSKVTISLVGQRNYGERYVLSTLTLTLTASAKIAVAIGKDFVKEDETSEYPESAALLAKTQLLVADLVSDGLMKQLAS